MLTRSGDVPLEIPLFAEPEARVIVFTGADVELGDAAGPGRGGAPDPGELTLRRRAAPTCAPTHGVRHAAVRRGPGGVRRAAAERLVDELFLTLAPKLAGGGDGPA